MKNAQVRPGLLTGDCKDIESDQGLGWDDDANDE